MESAAAGIPQISYQVELHHVIVISGETGFLIPENNLEEIKNRLTYILYNPDAAAPMGECARQLVKTKHSFDVVRVEKIAAYEKLNLL